MGIVKSNPVQITDAQKVEAVNGIMDEVKNFKDFLFWLQQLTLSPKSEGFLPFTPEEVSGSFISLHIFFSDLDQTN